MAVAVALSLMFVAVLLAAGLWRSSARRTFSSGWFGARFPGCALLVEKMALAAACAVVVTLLLLLGLGIFIPLEWGRFPLWVVGLIAAATAFAAMGTAIGGLAREVSTASLMAFLCSCRSPSWPWSRPAW